MATRFFLRDALSDIDPTANIDNLLSLTAGASATTSVTNTVAGLSPGVLVTKTAGGTGLRWYTNPLNALTFSSNQVTINFRGLESNAMANATLHFTVWKCNGDGTGASNLWPLPADQAELGTVEAALNYTSSPGGGKSITDGQRLFLDVFMDDAVGLTMASTFTVTLFYDGPTAGASGDSWIEFVDTVTEQVVATPTVQTFRPHRMLQGV